MRNEIEVLFEDKDIIKPLKDNRQYKIISLSNKIDCVIISDENSLKSAFSMIINIGYLNEKEDETDFSFFIIEKLIKENDELNNILKENSGKLNYKINEDWTFIFFEINSNYFIQALNIFGNYFNVNNLNNKRILENEKFILIRKKEIINYPLFKKIQCRKKIKCENFIEKIQNFFLSNYTSDKIKISLITKENFSQIEQILNPLFSNFKFCSNKHSKTINNNINKVLSLQSLKFSKKSLFNIVFYINSEISFNPFLEYLIYMFQGSRPGNLEYDFRWRKYIEKMYIYNYYSFNKGHELTLSMLLSDFDFEPLIIKTLNYIQSIQKKSKIEETYNDLKYVYENKFKFLNIDKYEQFLYDITFNLFDEKDKNLIFKQYFFPEFNNDVKEKILDLFNNLINNMMVIYYNPKNTFLRLNENLKKSNKYNIHFENDFYLFGSLNINEIKKTMNISYQWDQSMFLPKIKHNELLISNNNLISEKIEKEILLYLNLTNMKLWYKCNSKNQIPKIFSFFHIEFPEINNQNNLLQQQLNNLLINHIIKKIELKFDDIKIANNKIKVIYNEDGIDLLIITFENIFIKVINQILDYIFFPNDLKEIGGINYEERNYNNIKEKSLVLLGSVIKKNSELTPKLDFKISNCFNIYNTQIEKYGKEISKQLSVECFLYGFVREEILSFMKNYLQNHNNSNIYYIKKKYKNLFEQKSIYIFQIPLNFQEKNVDYLICFFQIGFRDDYLDIYSSLICNLFNKNNNQNIIMEKVYKDDIIYLRIIMNENNKILNELLNVLEREILDFCNIKFSENDIKENLIYLKKEFDDNNFKKKFYSIWYEISKSTYNFKRNENILKLLNNIEISELKINCEKFMIKFFVDQRREVIFMCDHLKKNSNINLNLFPKGLKINISNQLKYINEI